MKKITLIAAAVIFLVSLGSMALAKEPTDIVGNFLVAHSEVDEGALDVSIYQTNYDGYCFVQVQSGEVMAFPTVCEDGQHYLLQFESGKDVPPSVVDIKNVNGRDWYHFYDYLSTCDVYLLKHSDDILYGLVIDKSFREKIGLERYGKLK